ncbi:hypothetical protein CVT26_008835 [Gymnopilus dilepis]|uniref:Uncharacterized protein n=1 Tax=Gymnopilus dilepis TaxID=231916 RepID=A0A409X298_9AGAR|nr:hypothetical protein CVT26_008835 [Gymnopilus dilepis]
MSASQQVPTNNNASRLSDASQLVRNSTFSLPRLPIPNADPQGSINDDLAKVFLAASQVLLTCSSMLSERQLRDCCVSAKRILDNLSVYASPLEKIPSANWDGPLESSRVQRPLGREKAMVKVWDGRKFIFAPRTLAEPTHVSGLYLLEGAEIELLPLDREYVEACKERNVYLEREQLPVVRNERRAADDPRSVATEPANNNNIKRRRNEEDEDQTSMKKHSKRRVEDAWSGNNTDQSK